MNGKKNNFLPKIPENYRSGAGAALLLMLIFFVVFFNSLFESAPPAFYEAPVDSTIIMHNVVLPPLDFCGEKVPTANPEVKRRVMDAFDHITFNQSPYLMLNKKAHRWFPVIEPILKKYGVPDDFKYVVVIESALINSPDQPKAGGFWQLMPPVASHYGLEINSNVDERFNVKLATEAACRCIKDAYQHYHNWTLAVASYDLGTGGLDAQIGRQNATDYYELKLNEETSQYIYRLLAFKELISDPEHYGYTVKKNSLYSPVPTHDVKVDSSISDLEAFAVSNGSDLKTVKWLNPWILGNSLPNDSAKTYYILFPAKGFMIYGMNEDYSGGTKDTLITDSFTLSIDSIKPDSVHL